MREIIFPGFVGNDPVREFKTPERREYNGKFVLRCKPQGASYFDIGQWFKVETGTQYLFRVRYKALSGTTAKGMMLHLSKKVGRSVWTGFSSASYDSKTCRFEGVFSTPADSLVDGDNKARLRVVVADSTARCEFYCCDFALYQMNDHGELTGENLFKNSDFAYGLLGWSSSAVQPEEESEKTTFTEGFKFIKMLRFSEELFMEDYSDKFFKDGKEWAKEFE